MFEVSTVYHLCMKNPSCALYTYGLLLCGPLKQNKMDLKLIHKTGGVGIVNFWHLTRKLTENVKSIKLQSSITQVKLLHFNLCQNICILYLYSAQYLHVLQDSKRYMTHLTAQMLP